MEKYREAVEGELMKEKEKKQKVSEAAEKKEDSTKAAVEKQEEEDWTKSKQVVCVEVSGLETDYPKPSWRKAPSHICHMEVGTNQSADSETDEVVVGKRYLEDKTEYLLLPHIDSQDTVVWKEDDYNPVTLRLGLEKDTVAVYRVIRTVRNVERFKAERTVQQENMERRENALNQGSRSISDKAAVEEEKEIEMALHAEEKEDDDDDEEAKALRHAVQGEEAAQDKIDEIDQWFKDDKGE